MEFSMDDIKNMSDEQIAELNRRLGKQALKNFFGIMLLKWGLIIGVSYVVKHGLESLQKEIRDQNN